QMVFGGSLQVSLLNGFVPTRLNKFDLIDWSTHAGTFSALQLPALGGSLAWNTSNLYQTGTLSVVDLNKLPGDLNLDHQITSADLTLLLQALVDPTAFENQYGISAADLAIVGDANESGTFDNADIQGLIGELLNGTSFSAGSAPDLNPVPEPSALFL